MKASSNMKPTIPDIITGIITLVGLVLLEQGQYIYGLLTLIFAAINWLSFAVGAISEKLDCIVKALEDLKE
jgi:hypothetical protein